MYRACKSSREKNKKQKQVGALNSGVSNLVHFLSFTTPNLPSASGSGKGHLSPSLHLVLAACVFSLLFRLLKMKNKIKKHSLLTWRHSVTRMIFCRAGCHLSFLSSLGELFRDRLFHVNVCRGANSLSPILRAASENKTINFLVFFTTARKSIESTSYITRSWETSFLF